MNEANNIAKQIFTQAGKDYSVETNKRIIEAFGKMSKDKFVSHATLLQIILLAIRLERNAIGRSQSEDLKIDCINSSQKE